MAAPLAHVDDDRQDSTALRTVSNREPRKCGVRSGVAAAGEADADADAAAAAGVPVPDELPELRGSVSGDVSTFRSMGDLVKDFDQRLAVCFRDRDTDTDPVAPVGVIAEETLLLRDDRIWNALTDNFGHVMPIDWKHSRTRSLYVPTFKLEEKPKVSDGGAEPSDDDEELREQLDMHSIIVSCLAEEPLFTAEQVIEEIEEMMQDSPDLEAEQNPSQSDPSMLSLDVQRSSPRGRYEETVKVMGVAELNQRLGETEMAIKGFSEELIHQLALRDELDFEKEVKNSFISVLIDVQNRQKEQRESLKKKKKLKSGAGAPQGHAQRTLGSRFSMEGLSSVIQNGFRQTFGSGCSEIQYLTTVIPYEKKGGPPSLQDLRILTKILQAMRDDSDKVPGLLTDYILRVLCPT